MATRGARVLVGVTLSLVVGAAGCSASEPEAEAPAVETAPSGHNGDVVTVDGLRLPAKVEPTGISLGMGDRFEHRFWPGVNLGATVPGTSPGELAASRADYDRWFLQMDELGVKVIRVYTIMPPHFYEALVAHNEADPNSTLHFMQGVWIPEEEFYETQNAYSPEVDDGFERELADAVGAVHGGGFEIEHAFGHAHGTYNADAARYLLAWSIGIEWDAAPVISTNALNHGEAPYAGRYIEASADASPMESWLASKLDFVAAEEAAEGWSRPLTVTNWATTDPLRHPSQPVEDEVSIDANHLSATPAWPAGVFASYHAYPYYPDFFNMEYQDYIRPDTGRADPYAGYLHALKVHHGTMPVMITEFGIPTSLGQGHNGALDRDQGDVSEADAGSALASMMTAMKAEGLAGGIVFEWADEWFKRTWNTQPYELPGDRRQLWRNPLTNEEFFGILSTEPGDAPVFDLDGSGREWTAENSAELGTTTPGVTSVRVATDPQFVHLLITGESDASWSGSRLAMDTRPGTNAGLPGLPGVAPEADVEIVLSPTGASIRQAAWTDPFSADYGVVHGYVPTDAATLAPGSGVWVEPRQMLNRPLEDPSTKKQYPAEHVSHGTLRSGPGDSDPRNLVMAAGTTMELRIPWAMLGFSDPSSHQVLVIGPEKAHTTQTVGPVGVALVSAAGEATAPDTFDWEDWETVTWHERKKASWPALRAVFSETSGH